MARLPQVTAREMIRFLTQQGYVETRRSGSHATLWNENRGVAVTVPVHKGCDLGRGLAARILKDAGFSVEEFLKLR